MEAPEIEQLKARIAALEGAVQAAHEGIECARYSLEGAQAMLETVLDPDYDYLDTDDLNKIGVAIYEARLQIVWAVVGAMRSDGTAIICDLGIDDALKILQKAGAKPQERLSEDLEE